jgi:hypothetical protein
MDITAKEGSQTQKVYQALTEELRKCYDAPLEIEILPSGISPPDGLPFFLDGQCLGIPKKTLAAAFLYGRHIFMSQLDNLNSNVCLTLLNW